MPLQACLCSLLSAANRHTNRKSILGSRPALPRYLSVISDINVNNQREWNHVFRFHILFLLFATTFLLIYRGAGGL